MRGPAASAHLGDLLRFSVRDVLCGALYGAGFTTLADELATTEDDGLCGALEEMAALLRHHGEHRALRGVGFDENESHFTLAACCAEAGRLVRLSGRRRWHHLGENGQRALELVGGAMRYLDDPELALRCSLVMSGVPLERAQSTMDAATS